MYNFSKNVLVHFTVCLIMLVSQCLSVSRDNFKACDQSGFCKRQRSTEAGQSSYKALLNSLRTTSTSIELQLINKQNDQKFILQIFGLQDKTVRFKINELSPLKLRYEIPYGEVLTKEPLPQEMKVDESSRRSITFKMEDITGVISADPFKIDLYSEDKPVVSLNALGLLKFEHLRIKPGWFSSIGSGIKSWFSTPFRDSREPEPQKTEEEDAAEKKEEDKQEVKEENKEENKDEKPKEEPDLWEETYKSFTDSKPNGPTSVGMDINFPGFQFVYGIPLHADSLALKTTKNGDPYRLFNLDVFEYELYNPMALYGSVPMMIAHNEKQTVGVFWHNAAETWVDISSNVADKTIFSKMADFVQGNNEIPQTDTHWFSESGVIDLFVMMGPRPKDVFRQYARLTGTTALPPLFSIAYHQCRWNYNDETDVASVEENMDKVDIPFDVLWLDIEHTDGKRYFTWANDKFPNPKEMIGKLSSKGRKLVIIVDPHLKKDDAYEVYTDARSKGFFVKNRDGSDYEGWCWPGTSAWPDFTNPEVQQWWAGKFVYDVHQGATPDLFVWNDMNEPSVFNGPEVTFHKDVIHYRGFENRDVHNVYGMYVQKATADGLIQRSGGKDRPFVLSRAFFAGSQKYGAVWTGDNMGEWSHLKIATPMILSLNIAGITFSGADVGGFFRNPEAELQTRWYQAGSFYPFFRAHAHLDTKRREPYLLPEENMKIVRDAIRFRYSLLPYLYTEFYLAEKDGRPIMQPLWVEFPEEVATFGIDDNFLLGPALLVRPVTEQGATTANVYFPGSDTIWYDVQTYNRFTGGEERNVAAPLNKIPVYQRGGFIIPRKMRIRRSATLSYQDPFTLIICLDKQGRASGSLYVDDYRTFNYKNGEYIHRHLHFENNHLESKNLAKNNNYKTKEWIEKIVIVGFTNAPGRVLLKKGDGSSVELGHSFNSENKVFTIRKPDVNVAEDWTLSIN